jgi:DNA polymerase-3 subunit beta
VIDLPLLARAAEVRASIPILSHVLIRPDGTAMTTDMDVALTVRDAFPAGLVAAPACYPVKQAGMLAQGATLPTLPAEDFPILAPPAHDEDTVSFVLPAPMLRTALESVSPAISTGETRYYSNGVSFHDRPDGLTLVATDGHRLMRAVLPVMLPSGSLGRYGVIVPRRAVTLLLAVLKTAGSVDASVTVWPSGRIRVQAGRYDVLSKTIDDTFPAYERVMPRAEGNRLTVNATVLAATVKKVAAAGPYRPRSVRLDLSRDGVTVSCRDGTGTAMSLPVPGATYTGEALEIRFQARYLRDMLKPAGKREVSIWFGGARPPCRADLGEGLTGVIMPMRV